MRSAVAIVIIVVPALLLPACRERRASASPLTVTTPDLASPQPAVTTSTRTAHASGATGPLEYRRWMTSDDGSRDAAPSGERAIANVGYTINGTGVTPPAYTGPLMLLSGQSNARDQAAYLPTGSYVAVARGNQSIRRWDWDAEQGDLGRQLLQALADHRFGVLVWWQGETDGLRGMSRIEYSRRLTRLLRRVNLPTVIIEMSDNPSRLHLKKLQAALADDDPRVGLIDTSDLPLLNAHDFSNRARPRVSERLIRCVAVQCWRTPGEFR